MWAMPWGLPCKKLQDLALAWVHIRKVIQDGKPFLGICLGFQLYCSKEALRVVFVPGLKEIFLEGSVERFTDLKVPHMGWNQSSGYGGWHAII